MKSSRKPCSIAACAVLILTATAAGAAGLKPDTENEVVARMGAIEIKRGEVERMLGLNGGQALPSLAQMDPLLRAELLRRAVLEEARRSEWEKRPEVRQQLELAKEQVIVSSFVNQQARPAADYPSEPEIRTAYEANKSRFVQPAQFHLQQIYLSDFGSGQGDAEASARRADELWKLARTKGSDFAKLAGKHSAHAESAAKGGDMGWMAENALVPEIRAAVQGMAAGEIGKPVKVSNGWHILRLIERKAPAQLTYAEVKDSLVQSLRLGKAKENEQKYLSQLIGKTPIAINEISLSALKGDGK